MRLIEFWASHGAELAAMLQRHVLMVGVSAAVALAVGLPAGVLAAHRPSLGRPVLALANIAQTIPSLALLGFLLPLPFIGGVGPRVAIAALILYALLPIVRGTVAGLKSIDPAVVTAGRAMGMTSRQLLWIVELPLALPSIVAGVRIAIVISIGTATVAAAVGAGGLGEYIFRGLSMVDSTVILAGAIPVALLAVAADTLLTWAETKLQRPGKASRATVAAVGAASLLVLAAMAGRTWDSSRDTIVVGSKNFTEQILLGELMAQRLERAGLNVTRTFNLGGTFICDRALRSGDIDIYAEYTGTALTAVFRQPVVRDSATVLEAVRDRYAEGGLTVLPPFGFNNTFAILVRRADAETLALRTIGDLKKVSAAWTPGFGYEFVDRDDGYRGLAAAYGLAFTRAPKVMDLALMYRALASREVDVVAGDATSALIDALDLALLEDDHAYFPPYDAVPVARSSTLLRHPAVGVAIEGLAGRISASRMRAMNHAVDVEHRDAAEVVRETLAALGL